MAAELTPQMLKSGIRMIPPEQGTEALMMLMNEDIAQVAVLPTNSSFGASGRRLPLLELLAPSPPASAPAKASLLQRLAEASHDNRLALLTAHVQGQVAEVLGWYRDQPLDTRKVFSELGMDSLMVVELRNRLQSSLELRMASMVAFDYPTVEQLAAYLFQQLFPVDGNIREATKGNSRSPIDAQENLPEEDLRALLDRELQMLDEDGEG